MSSTAYDDQYMCGPEEKKQVTISTCGIGMGSAGSTATIIGGGGSGGAGSYYSGYGAVPPVGSGAVGATGSFTLPSGTLGVGSLSPQWSSINSGTTSISTSVLSIMAEGDGDAMIKTKKNTINLDEMATMMETLKKRLLILTPNFEQHEKYPVLKDLYEQYKVVEAMLKEDDKK
jgi:hypothetical protein